MAKKVTLSVDADTGDALKEISKLFKTLIDNQEKAAKSQETLNKEVASVSKSAKAGAKGLKLLAKGFSGIGLAIKAAGIGLALDAFNLFKEVLSENQVIADAFATAFEGVKIVFNQTIGVVIDLVKELGNTEGSFDAITKVTKGLITLGLTPLKLLFNQISLAVKTVQLAWEQSIFGGKDADKIKDLKIGIEETKLEILKIGVEAVQAGKDIINNIGEAVTETVDIATKAVDGLSKISVKGALEAGKAAVEARNNALLAGADLEILIAKLENSAEKQRQIRDDETNSIEVRKKANDELIKLLEEQGKAAVKLAQIQAKAAQADLANDPTNIEKQVAAKQALAAVESERVRTTSALSEALTNKNALDKEGLEIDNSRLESQNQISIEAKKFNAEQIENDVKRLESLKAIAEEEKQIELDRLQTQIDAANEGTQAKIDAENALREFKEEKRQEDIEREEELKQAKADELALEAENEFIAFEERRALLAERRALIEEDETLSAEERLSRLEEQTALENGLEQSKIAQQNATLNNLQRIAGEESALGKAILLAKQALAAKELILQIKSDIAAAKSAATKATIKGAESGVDVAAGAAKTASSSPFPANIPLIIGYAATAVGIVSSIASAVKKVKGAKAPSASGTDTPSQSSQPTAQTSNFNIVGEGGSNQLADVIADQTQNQPPARSFVVSSDITSSQQLDRNIEDSASVLD